MIEPAAASQCGATMILRILTGVLALGAAALLARMVYVLYISPNLTQVIGIFTVSAFFVLTGGYAVFGSDPGAKRTLSYAATYGVILGGIGLLAGSCVLPFFYPESNLAWIMGIFFYGPIGFGAGVVIGFVVGMFKRQQKS